MKKIGFIDYFLDEWHANNYPAWLRENIAAVGRDMEVAYAWAMTAAPSGLDTAGWCQKYAMEPLASIEEVVEKSDYLIVFSPDHPQYHEELARLPLMSGKPTYIDKTFSPDLASGARMFALAEQHGAPMFSCSALRYATELASFPDEKVNRNTLEYVATSGPGRFANYAVHQFEMIVFLLGPGAERVKSLSSQHGVFLSVEYGDERRASMLQTAQTPFQLSLQLRDGEGLHIPQCSDIFPRLIDSTLDFFESGQAPVPQEETLEIMALIDAGGQALARRDTWVQVEKG